MTITGFMLDGASGASTEDEFRAVVARFAAGTGPVAIDAERAAGAAPDYEGWWAQLNRLRETYGLEGVPLVIDFVPHSGTRRGRKQVEVRISPALPIDARIMDPDEIVTIIRDALLRDGGMQYVDAYARDIKSAAA